MKAGNQQNLPPNKKLVLHFDIEGVLRLPNRKNKDLYVIHHQFRSTICALNGFGENFKGIIRKMPTK